MSRSIEAEVKRFSPPSYSAEHDASSHHAPLYRGGSAHTISRRGLHFPACPAAEDRKSGAASGAARAEAAAAPIPVPAPIPIPV